VTRAPATLDRSTALETISAACERQQLDRTRIVLALDALDASEPGDDVSAAVLGLGEAIIGGAFGSNPRIDVLERCIDLLSRTPYRKALDFYRAAAAVHAPTPHGDVAGALRGRALLAVRGLEPNEARFLAAALLADGNRSLSGEPAASALAVLGAAADDVALLLACRTVLADELPLTIMALQQLSPDVPPQAFWAVAAPFVGDRFSDAVLAITDIIVEGRRSDLVPGFGAALTQVADPDLMRAVFLSLTSAHLDGLDAAYAAAVEGAPRRALEGLADALDLARMPTQQALLQRLQERLRLT
jgi:hypothetical protein